MSQIKIIFSILLFSFMALGAGTYIKGPALIEGFTAVTSAAGTTTLTKDSETKQILTGATTQTFTLPDATTIPLGRKFYIINKSTGTATVNASGGSLVATVLAGQQKEFHLRVAGSAAGTWDATRILVDLTNDVTGTLAVANGGTGAASFTSNYLLSGNGSGVLNTVAVGASGDVLLSNGTNFYSGSLPYGAISSIASKSADYTATATDRTLVFTASATLSLPAAAANSGLRLEVLISGSDSIVVTIDPNSTELVCGQSTIKLFGNKDGIVLQSNGTAWLALNGGCYATRIARVTNPAGTPGVTDSSGVWVSSITDNGTGNYTMNLVSGVFSNLYMCTFTADAGDTTTRVINPGTSSVQITCDDAESGSRIDCGYFMECRGER